MLEGEMGVMWARARSSTWRTNKINYTTKKTFFQLVKVTHNREKWRETVEDDKRHSAYFNFFKCSWILVYSKYVCLIPWHSCHKISFLLKIILYHFDASSIHNSSHVSMYFNYPSFFQNRKTINSRKVSHSKVTSYGTVK